NPTWISGNTTTAVIRIRNLNTDASGNDFGLDDISFSTLSPFITLVSPTGTDAQTMCFNSSIAPIVYSVGSDATGHSILNLPPGVTGSFSVPNYLTITGTPTEVGNYNYSITTIGTCNPVTVYGTINIPSASTSWLGSVSNDWSDPNNWSCATVPTATTNVVIPAAATRMPRLTATSMCKVLNMEAATKLDLGGQLFTNFGGITGRGVFKGSVSSSLIIDVAEKTSTVRFDQSAPGKSNALNNFTIKGPGNLVNLNTKLALYGALAPQAGTLAINDTLILRSTAAATARVGVVTGKLAYGSAGKVQVERYFPARRSWRLVTSPLAKAGTIFETWQNGGKYEAGKGTYVSGIGATNPISDNGLDWSPMNNSSLKVGVMLTPVLDTKAALSKNAGDSSDNIPYFLFVRGDRDPVNTNTTMTNITTLSSAGKLQTGAQVFTASSNMAGITFVGNPYASPIDFSKLQLNNLKKHFWAWDPYLNTEQGGFILVEETSAGHYEMIPQSPAGLSQVLESSQSFFVETKTNGPASIVFQESAKSDASTNLTAFRPMGTTQSLRANLYHLNENNNTLLLDGVMALFDSSFSKSVDNDDVVKQSNYKEMLALVRDNKTLTLERRPLPDSDDTLFLRLTKTTQRRYRFEFEPVGLQPTLAAYLEDSYTGAKTPLNIAGNSVVDFEINGDAGSAVINRFRIIFKLATATLPVTYKNISARQVEENISVNWTVENEINIKSYEVEKSNNGIDFKKVNTTVATGTNRSTIDYKWIDENPFTGNNYYRVRNISADGKYENSKTVLVKMANAASGINVFPNPSSTDKIGVSFKNMADGIYNVRLINALGQTMLKTSIDHLAGTSFENIVPGKKLVTGVYQLVVANPDHTTTTIKVIVQ
ncbi:MAG: T9SS type A sorting domain-containing protein, partial [Ferruginibacter sp.]